MVSDKEISILGHRLDVTKTPIRNVLNGVPGPFFGMCSRITLNGERSLAVNQYKFLVFELLRDVPCDGLAWLKYFAMKDTMCYAQFT